MIDIERCKIEIKLTVSYPQTKAMVTIRQDNARISGFLLKDGPFGLFLDPPKIAPKYFAAYFDEDKQRYKRLQDKVIETYREKLESANTNEVEFDEKLLDEVWDNKKST